MKTCFLMAALAAAASAQLLPPGLPGAGPGAAAPAADLKPDTVVATVAGMSITVDDVRQMLDNSPQAFKQAFQKDPLQAIDSEFVLRFLAAEGEKAHLADQSPLKEELEAVYKLVRQQVLANQMVNEEYNHFEVTGEAIDEFYQKNQARWAEAKIKIIMLAFKPGAPGAAKEEPKDIDEKLKQDIEDAVQNAHSPNNRTQEQALVLAKDLVAQLRKGADFGKLVTQYSDDAESKASAGDFGTPIKASSSFAQDLKKVVFDMKPGDISDPVQQGNGYYIIRLEEKTVLPINDVRSQIVKEIRDAHQDEFLRGLNKRFTPQVQRPDFFAQPGRYLSQQPGPAPATPPAPAASTK